MRRLILAAIVAYQRYLSPHKGFSCAYRIHTGRGSCSALGFRAVRRYGVIAGLMILRRRTYLCGLAYRRCARPSDRFLHAQQGFCDLSCDLPCDAPSFDACQLYSLGDLLSCCDCGGCDWSSRNRKREKGEQYVYIPPKVKR
ncbi:membrane protein insertion efficiency factor YidD [Chitinimonas sp.]|uniref:membrane protein insertion efficiency factor YidD n=1 Tax=Chitinimonas sp. TaxID=1934313 RepID=UPI0035B4723D